MMGAPALTPARRSDGPRKAARTPLTGALADVWGGLQHYPWAYDDRPATAAEARRGLASTWRHPRGASDWQEIPGVGIQHAHEYQWVIIDCDHDADDQWRCAGLPPPALLVVNNRAQRHPGRHHIAWRLSAPVGRTNSHRRGPVNFLRLVHAGLCLALRGDLAYHINQPTTKNPRCRERFDAEFWGRAVSLDDLAARVDLEAAAAELKTRARQREHKLIGEAESSRNCALFEAFRHKGYRWVDRHGKENPEALYDYLFGLIADANSKLPVPLPIYEFRAIVASITRFCIERYRPRTRRRKTETPASKTDRIIAAAAAICADGRRPTLAQLTAATGVPRSTISRLRGAL
jgi:hypothetical protein